MLIPHDTLAAADGAKALVMKAIDLFLIEYSGLSIGRVEMVVFELYQACHLAQNGVKMNHENILFFSAVSSSSSFLLTKGPSKYKVK